MAVTKETIYYVLINATFLEFQPLLSTRAIVVALYSHCLKVILLHLKTVLRNTSLSYYIYLSLVLQINCICLHPYNA